MVKKTIPIPLINAILASNRANNFIPLIKIKPYKRQYLGYPKGDGPEEKKLRR